MQKSILTSIRYQNKENQSSFVNAEAYLKSIGQLKTLHSDTLFYFYQKNIFNEVMSQLKASSQERPETMEIFSSNSSFSSSANLNSPSILSSFVFSPSTGIGAPAAIVDLEQFYAQGIRKVITFGSAGSLNPKNRKSDILIINKAFRDEGTSSHYLTKTQNSTDEALEATEHSVTSESSESSEFSFCDEELLHLFTNTNAMNFPSVASWTTDAPYRETKAEIEHYKEKGLGVVEMETSAVYTWAHYRKVKALSLVIISDELFENEWNPFFKNKELVKKAREALIKIIYNFS